MIYLTQKSPSQWKRPSLIVPSIVPECQRQSVHT